VIKAVATGGLSDPLNARAVRALRCSVQVSAVSDAFYCYRRSNASTTSNKSSGNRSRTPAAIASGISP
jgi:hypothetical protein